jgi:glycosyltransferase involved in cell wall biosynthesis
LYFDPENPVEIAQTLRKYLDSSALRSQKLKASVRRSKQYTWEKCSNETFAFLAKMGLGKTKR